MRDLVSLDFSKFLLHIFSINCNETIIGYANDTAIFFEADDWYTLKINTEENC